MRDNNKQAFIKQSIELSCPMVQTMCMNENIGYMILQCLLHIKHMPYCMSSKSHYTQIKEICLIVAITVREKSLFYNRSTNINATFVLGPIFHKLNI